MFGTIQYDEVTKLYYIRDEVTQEIISASYNESDLDLYKEHPDYNPNPHIQRSRNLYDYVIQEIEE